MSTSGLPKPPSNSSSTFGLRSPFFGRLWLADKYKVCQIPVKVLSRACPCTSSWTKIGHENPIFVHSLSNHKTLPTINSRYCTNSGQTLGVDTARICCLAMRWLKKSWTNSRQSLDSVSCGPRPMACCPTIRQTLDKHWTCTNSRQSMDYCSCGPWPTLCPLDKL